MVSVYRERSVGQRANTLVPIVRQSAPVPAVYMSAGLHAGGLAGEELGFFHHPLLVLFLHRVVH